MVLTVFESLQVKSVPRVVAQLLVLFTLLAYARSLPAQAVQQPSRTPASGASHKKEGQPRKGYGSVTAVGLTHDKNGPAVEIISTRPVIPEIQQLDNPSRLVIDLPATITAVPRKRISVQTMQISTIRIDQYQNDPPITRVVVDLLTPRPYTWDATGNRLLVHLQGEVEKSSQPPSVATFSTGVRPAVVPRSPGGSGAVVLAGTRLAGGSSVTAGADTAVLSLSRGGEIRVCPGTTVSVTSSESGRDFMLGMSTGALETHFNLDASANSVLTPDFRILLPGPGEFHYAVRADSYGNTCVRGLPGNTASAIVLELMGDRTYQVRPTDQLLFYSGRVDKVQRGVALDCGCPPPAEPVMLASTPSAPVVSDEDLPATTHLAQPGEQARPLPPAPSTSGFPSGGPPPSAVTLSVIGPETAPLPTSRPDDVHVQVDAPLVFRAADSVNARSAPTREVGRLPLASADRAAKIQTLALPPPSAQPPPHHGFFRRVKGFFSAIFH